jgi:hypothetical protein
MANQKLKVFVGINAIPVVRKGISLLMISLLLLLTCANFFYYPSSGDSAVYAVTDSEAPIQGPVEEKSNGSGFSIMEEMMHHTDTHFGISMFDALREYIIDKGKELPCVHFELITPPPEFIS